MNHFIGLGLKLLLLSLALLLFLKFSAKKKKIGWFVLTGVLFLTTPLFQYLPQNIFYHFTPFIPLFYLYLIFSKILKHPLIIPSGLFLVFISSCLATNILTFRFGFQAQNTILANHHIDESVSIHRLDALYLPFTLRPLLFNQLGYIYYWLSNTFYYLSALNFNNIFLITNLVPLVAGILKLIKNPNKKLNIFIFGSFAIVFLVMGFSRPVNEMNSFYTIYPLFFYLILTGFEKIKIRHYLIFLLFNLYFLRLI